MNRIILIIVSVFLVSFSFLYSNETDVHYTMDYVDGNQKPVPPEAFSPFAQQDTIYVTEPYIELDSDWNMDVKLFSKYRYTNEFVEKWRAKYGYTPTSPITTDEDFFKAINLDLSGFEKVKKAVQKGDYTEARKLFLLSQAKRSRPYQLKTVAISKEAGEAAVEEADKIMADPDFPNCRPGMKFSLWGLMYNLDRAYRHSKDMKYAEAWLEMFNHWYETCRPPAQRPEMYISFIWMPYWRTLGAGGSAIYLCDIEKRILDAYENGLDTVNVFNVYKSILEHAQYLYLCNDVFLPSNWQTHQGEAMIKLGAYFPYFKEAKIWQNQAWALTQEHIFKETYEDGTHCENSVGYAIGVINQYFNTIKVVRKLGVKIPDEFLEKWESMYLWAVKILPPTGNYVPCGDNGMGTDGALIKRAIIKGALEFDDPTMKYFAERYPEDVARIAENEFEETDEILDSYKQVTPQLPSYTSILLPNTGWAVMRESWNEKSPYLFFDYGWDEAWHSHPDFGSFNIWAFGEPLLTECGRSGSYEADISKRWYKQTIAHNTVLVDSRSMRKCVNNRLEQWWTGDNYDFADAISDGYRWIGVLHNRRVLFVKSDYWIVTDFLPGPSYYGTSFQTSGYHEFDWLAHFQPTELEIDNVAKRIYTKNEDANLVLIPLNADEVEIRESEGPVSTPSGAKDAPYISLHQEGMAFVQYQTLLFPYEGKERPEINITNLKTDKVNRDYRKNIGYEIDILNRKDIFLESGNSTEKTSFGKYEFCGKTAHIQNAETSKAQYLLLEADYLSFDGKLIFYAPKPIEAIEFSITQSGKHSVLEIVTESNVSGVKICIPNVKKVRVNNKNQKFSKKGKYFILK
ncbi:MAG: heparinase II/III family protein [Planctomycetes bacterium]|nr:heparinase II/III family protein [Planctomycetota bacterium]